jgi:hypothetical protein
LGASSAAPRDLYDFFQELRRQGASVVFHLGGLLAPGKSLNYLADAYPKIQGLRTLALPDARPAQFAMARHGHLWTDIEPNEVELVHPSPSPAPARLTSAPGNLSTEGTPSLALNPICLAYRPDLVRGFPRHRFVSSVLAMRPAPLHQPLILIGGTRVAPSANSLEHSPGRGFTIQVGCFNNDNNNNNLPYGGTIVRVRLTPAGLLGDPDTMDNPVEVTFRDYGMGRG